MNTLQSLPNVGAATTANSLPVNIASDQVVPVSGSVTAQITDGSNTVTVSTAALDGNNATANRLRVSAVLMGNNGGASTTAIDSIRVGISSVVSVFTGFLNTVNFLKYNATPPALTDGQGAPLQGDAAGQLKVTMTKGAQTTANSVAVTVASDQIIKVAGTTTDIIVTPVVTTSAYSPGNCIGGASAGGSAILSLANAVRISGGYVRSHHGRNHDRHAAHRRPTAHGPHRHLGLQWQQAPSHLRLISYHAQTHLLRPQLN